MSELINVMYNSKPCYDIVIEDSWDRLSAYLERLNTFDKNVCIVTDSNVDGLYTNEIIDVVSNYSKKTVKFCFEAGEKSKNLNTINKLYDVLIQERFNRNDMLIALGGGVAGDMTGFAAATYLRGIDFIQIPTSLLAQVDSSIGGKTGVDYNGYKNMIGAFKQPSLVYINTSTLRTLDRRQFLSGMGEVIKYGFIKDRAFFDWLNDNISSIISLNSDALEYLISRSCRAKKVVVENDFMETGERATLNFGHTIGHAVEKMMNFELLHGECVAIGMCAALYLSMQKGKITSDDYIRGVNVIKAYDLPVNVSGISDEDIHEAAMHDKKVISSGIKFILLDEIGKAVIDTTVTSDEMLKAIDTILV